MRRAGLAAVLLAGILGTGALAADDPADIAFWTSVRNTGNPAELQAYIAAFPQGRFVELARIRIRALAGGAAAPAIAPAAAPASPAARAAMVWVVPTRTRLRLVDPVVVDVDARGLVSGSNHRLAVVPAGTPDAVLDPTQFGRESMAVPPSRTRVSLPLSTPGRNEVRLYYIPQFGTSFVVAARATIDVAPGEPGAILVSRLLQEAAATSPVRFEASYRDRMVTIEGQFLRVQPRTVDQVAWASLLGGAAGVEKPYVAMFVGRVGAERSAEGTPTELLCMMPAEDRTVLARVAALNTGDAVVLRGTPSTWQSVFGSVAVVLNPCAFAPG